MTSDNGSAMLNKRNGDPFLARRARRRRITMIVLAASVPIGLNLLTLICVVFNGFYFPCVILFGVANWPCIVLNTAGSMYLRFNFFEMLGPAAGLFLFVDIVGWALLGVLIALADWTCTANRGAPKQR